MSLTKNSDKCVVAGDRAEDILEEAPCGFATALPDGTLVRVNAKLEQWTGKPREELLASTRLQDLFRRGESIYFETHVRPLLLMQGEVKEIACHIVHADLTPRPVFMNCTAKHHENDEVSFIRVTFFDASDRKKYEDELRLRRRQAEQLAAIVASSKDAIVSIGLDLVVRTWNEGARTLFGFTPDEAVGQSITSLIVPSSHQAQHAELYQQVLNCTETVLTETDRLHKNGELIPVEMRASTTRGEDGHITGISVIFRDITDRRNSEQQIRYVLDELNHRTKNLMAVIQSIVRLSSKSSDPENFQTDLSARLSSLAANQDLLIRGQYQRLDLETLIHTHVDNFCTDLENQLELHGDTIELDPKAGQSIGMAFHELATNALKYGALSRPGGKISIHWSSGDQFELFWQEHTRLADTEPSRSGFGTTVVTKLVEGATGGKTSVSVEPTGLCWKLVAPVKVVVSPVHGH